MKRKKTALKTKGKNNIYKNNIVRITKEDNEYFFEIGNELTSDIAEGVSILMRKCDWGDILWDIEISDIISEDISPAKSLFWLSGGLSEWRTLDNYNRPWCECYLDFQEEFGYLVINIIKRARTLKDVRDGFCKYLNLPTLYDFAMSKDMIK